jgi:hypothetical protein
VTALVVGAIATFVAPRIDDAVDGLVDAFGAAFARRPALRPEDPAGAATALQLRTPLSPAIGTTKSVLGVFTVLFFVPSLSLRYWALHPVAQLAGGLVVALAVAVGVRASLGRARLGFLGLVRWVTGAALAAVFAAYAAGSTVSWVEHSPVYRQAWRGVPELLLGAFAVVFLATFLVTFRASELLGAVSWARHEAKAPVDQA